MKCLAIDPDHELAQQILKEVMVFRRTLSGHSKCGSLCPACHGPHLSQVIKALRRGTAITFVLPAFPGKSPNLAKVLGPLPDKAEQLALQFLQRHCDRIAKLYPKGARIVICSDGRVFSDIVGLREADVTAYQKALDEMIEDLGLSSLSTFNLDEIYVDQNFAKMRQDLMETFGQTLESLKQKVLRGSVVGASLQDSEAHQMFCGITRFLVEDATFPGQTKTRSAIQRECKVKAYEVIRRSNAWSELIAQRFPEAVRLSIHPQACGSKKLGIRLIGNESWITPWHGVAFKSHNEFILLKRTEAESRGAQLIYSLDGRPSHFEEVQA